MTLVISLARESFASSVVAIPWAMPTTQKGLRAHHEKRPRAHHKKRPRTHTGPIHMKKQIVIFLLVLLVIAFLFKPNPHHPRPRQILTLRKQKRSLFAGRVPLGALHG